MALRSIGFGLVLALGALLAGCGGGGSGGGPGPSVPSGPKTGVTVDPYLVGAVLQELTPAGAVVQESSASDAHGAFTFPGALTAGNRVVLSARGLHNGAPYAVTLAARVQAGQAVVVSPLTTLVASGHYTADQVAALLAAALPGSALTAADVLADPMARMLDGQVTDADRQLLAGNIAVGAALAITHGDAGSAQLSALVAAIAPRVLAALSATGAPEAVASAAAAVADYVAKGSTTPAQATQAAAAVTDALLAQLVAAAAGGGYAGITTSGGTLQAETRAATVAACLERGHAALDDFLSGHRTDPLLAAVNEFSAAATLAGTDATATTAQKDEARFFAGLARLAILAQPYSDATDDGLDDLGGLLDAYGLGGSNADRASVTSYAFLDCSGTGEDRSCSLKQIPASAPRGRALQTFAAEKVAAGLRDAIALLDQVSGAFTSRLDNGGGMVELDATDVQLAKAVAQGMLAIIEVQSAYDLDANLAQLQSSLGERAGGSAPAQVRRVARLLSAPVRALAAQDEQYSLDQLLADNPSLLKLVGAPSLQAARTDALAACTTVLHALDLLEAETDDQSDDFFRLGGGQRCGWSETQQKVVCTPIDPAEDLARTRAEVREVQAVISATGNYTFDMGTADPEDDLTINPGKFFAGVDLRSMLPTFHAGASGRAPGMLPDPTLGGILVKTPVALDTDLDGDGSPDALGGFSYFFPQYLAGQRFWSGSYGTATLSGYWAFAASGNAVTFTGSGALGDAQEDHAATYTLSRNVLTITFTASVEGIGSVVVTADDLEDGRFEAEVVYRDAQGQPLASQWQHFYREGE